MLSVGHFGPMLKITETISPPAFDNNMNTAEQAQELTRQIENSISEEIMRYPQFWLWSYKYWRRSGDGTYPDNYPVY